MRNAINFAALFFLAFTCTTAFAQNATEGIPAANTACNCQQGELVFVTVDDVSAAEAQALPNELVSPNLPSELTEGQAPQITPTEQLAPSIDETAATVNKGGIDPHNPQPQQSEDFAIDAFPNPTSGMVSFTLPPYTGGSVQMQVYNTAGQQVYVGSGNSTGGPNPTISVDISFLPNGLYTFRMTNGAFAGITRVVLR